MTVVVGQGCAGIDAGTYPTSFKYWIANTTTTGTPAGESVTITTASASNPRIDTIVAYVNESATFTTSPVNFPTGFTLAAVAGTPNASPSAPSGATIQAAVGASNPYMVLADVLVGTSVTQINSGNITDRRSFATIAQNPYKFRVRRVAAWNSPATAFARLSFDTEDYDTNNNFDSTTNFRYTVPVAGFYQINARASVNGNIQHVIALYKNGSIYQRGTNGVGNAITGSSYSDLVQLAAGDYIELWIYTDTSNAGEVTTGSQAFFGGYLVSRA